MLYLVRHVPVDVDETVPPPEWRPSREGLRLARRLGGAVVWRRLAAVASSPEPKARATAEPIARTARVPLRVERDLREVERPGTPITGRDAYVERVRDFFANPATSVCGWEPGCRAAARFERCVDALVADAAGDVCIVAHGLVLSLYVARLEERSEPELDA